MQRQELKDLGLNDEQVGGVMRLYGIARQEIADETARIEAENEQTRLETERLKAEQEGIDPDEMNRLRQFKADHDLEEIRKPKREALTALFSEAGASGGGTKLLLQNINLDNIKLDHKGRVKGGKDLMKRLVVEYPDMFAKKEKDTPEQVFGRFSERIF